MIKTVGAAVAAVDVAAVSTAVVAKVDVVSSVVVAAAVVLPRGFDVSGIDDSKKLTEARREALAAARAAGYTVVAVPGASAVAASLMVAGITSDVAHFLGFLPRRASERRRVLAVAATWPGALVFFEAPHRIAEALKDASEVLGNREVSVCNDLTKRHERVWHAPLEKVVAEFRSDVPRGEFTVVVAPGSAGSREAGATPMPDPTSLVTRYEALVVALGDRKKAIRQLAQETGQPRKEVYAVIVRQAREDTSL